MSGPPIGAKARVAASHVAIQLPHRTGCAPTPLAPSDSVRCWAVCVFGWRQGEAPADVSLRARGGLSGTSLAAADAMQHVGINFSRATFSCGHLVRLRRQCTSAECWGVGSCESLGTSAVAFPSKALLCHCMAHVTASAGRHHYLLVSYLARVSGRARLRIWGLGVSLSGSSEQFFIAINGLVATADPCTRPSARCCGADPTAACAPRAAACKQLALRPLPLLLLLRKPPNGPHPCCHVGFGSRVATSTLHWSGSWRSCSMLSAAPSEAPGSISRGVLNPAGLSAVPPEARGPLPKGCSKLHPWSSVWHTAPARWPIETAGLARRARPSSAAAAARGAMQGLCRFSSSLLAMPGVTGFGFHRVGVSRPAFGSASYTHPMNHASLPHVRTCGRAAARLHSCIRIPAACRLILCWV